MRDLDAYYILDGRTVLKVGRETCYRWRAMKPEEKIIAQEDVGRFWVSTVFLTSDHNFDSGPPILFETMVFHRGADGKIDWGELYCDRRSTYEEAVAMHRQVREGVHACAIPEPRDQPPKATSP